MNSLRERYQALNNKTKRSDKFSVEFLGFPENVSNLLGRQVRSISRPNISFQPHETNFKGMKYSDRGLIEIEPVRMTLWDDEGAVTSNILYAQLFRQVNKFVDINGLFPDEDYKTRQYKFSVRVRLFDSLDNVVEEYVLQNCFLTSIEHSQPDFSDDSESTIDISLNYDNIAVKLFDEYLDLLDGGRKPPIL